MRPTVVVLAALSWAGLGAAAGCFALKTTPVPDGATSEGSGGSSSMSMDGPADGIGTGGAGAGPAGTGGSGGGIASGTGGRAPGTGGGAAGGSTGSGGSTTGTGGRGTGGSVMGTGGSAAGSGGAIAAPPCAGAVESTFAMGGYTDNGTWHGWAYTFGPASPPCPTPCFQQSGRYLCAGGTVPADPTFNAVAGLGWNVNQEVSTGSTEGTVTPTGTGVRINAPGATTSMRVQLSNGTTQWCAAIPAGGGSIPWSMFKRECWAGGSMEAYSMQAFSKLEIIVPSNSAQPTPFCVCAVSAGVY